MAETEDRISRPDPHRRRHGERMARPWKLQFVQLYEKEGIGDKLNSGAAPLGAATRLASHQCAEAADPSQVRRCSTGPTRKFTTQFTYTIDSVSYHFHTTLEPIGVGSGESIHDKCYIH